MKITDVTTRLLSTPAESPLVFGRPEAVATHDFVTLELGTDQGLVGVGVTYFGSALTATLKVAVDQLAGLLVGSDPTRVLVVPKRPGLGLTFDKTVIQRYQVG